MFLLIYIDHCDSAQRVFNLVMSNLKLPCKPKYYNAIEYNLSGLEATQIPDVKGLIRDLIIDEEGLENTLKTLLKDLRVAQSIFDTYSATHSEVESMYLQGGFDTRCGINSNCYCALSDIEQDVVFVVSAIQILNEYPGITEELWDVVRGKELTPLTSALSSSNSDISSGSKGKMPSVALGAVTHVDQMIELVKKVNTGIDYASSGAARIEAAVNWLRDETNNQNCSWGGRSLAWFAGIASNKARCYCHLHIPLQCGLTSV